LGGFVLASRWQMAPLLLAAALVGWAIGRLRPHWLPGACLLGYVTCAAGGVLLGVSPAMLIAGVALMLVSWELMDGREPDRARLTLLLASAGAGLLMAEAGLWVRLQLPFGGVLLAGGVALFGLYRFWRDARRA
jgi:hypothetical protein